MVVVLQAEDTQFMGEGRYAGNQKLFFGKGSTPTPPPLPCSAGCIYPVNICAPSFIMLTLSALFQFLRLMKTLEIPPHRIKTEPPPGQPGEPKQGHAMDDDALDEEGGLC